jgi:hypothetical protein
MGNCAGRANAGLAALHSPFLRPAAAHSALPNKQCGFHGVCSCGITVLAKPAIYGTAAPSNQIVTGSVTHRDNDGM